MASFIQGSCRLQNGKVILNGQEIFSSTVALNAFLEKAYGHLQLNYPKFYKMDNLSRLGFLASEVLLKGKDISSVNPFEISVVLSNSKGSLDTDASYFESMKKVASPALFVYTLPNIVNGEISIRHGLKGESTFFVTPSFDPDLLYAYSDEILKEKSKLCLAGWVDVLGERYEAFLYLIGKDNTGLKEKHSVENIKSLYSA
ncbi:MAG TPA: hypothetical protein VL728_10015 [Cyclobacteriaceae bacterium]|nr:hypothetical protein [Cyclobacteriaceae bacterium]